MAIIAGGGPNWKIRTLSLFVQKIHLIPTSSQFKKLNVHAFGPLRIGLHSSQRAQETEFRPVWS